MLQMYENPTIPVSYPVHISGFEDDESATQCENTIRAHIENLSKYLDLSRLDSIVISNNFDSALSSIDRGIGNFSPLSRTNDDSAVCVAKVVDVTRTNITKYCLVLYLDAFAPLSDSNKNIDENEDVSNAFYLLIHECAHIHLYTHLDKLFSEKTLYRNDSFENAILLAPMCTAWDEYAANRTASTFHRAQSMYASAADLLAKSLLNVSGDCKHGIERFYIHRNIKTLYEDSASRAFEPVRFFAYHLGNMDGAALSWDEFPELKKNIQNDVIFSLIFEELTLALRRLWDTFDSWQTFHVFYSLKKISSKLYTNIGIPIVAIPGMNER